MATFQKKRQTTHDLKVSFGEKMASWRSAKIELNSIKKNIFQLMEHTHLVQTKMVAVIETDYRHPSTSMQEFLRHHSTLISLIDFPSTSKVSLLLNTQSSQLITKAVSPCMQQARVSRRFGLE